MCELLYLNTAFWENSSKGHIGRQIFALDGSNDADSRKGWHVGSFVDIAAHHLLRRRLCDTGARAHRLTNSFFSVYFDV